MLAVSDVSLREKITGIVCLSTPFLQAWPRPLGGARIVTAGTGVVITLANVLFFILRKWLDTNLSLAIVSTLFLPANFAMGKLALRLANPNRPIWRLPSFDPERLLILRSAGDEASALLGTVTLVGYVITRIWAITAEGAPRYMRSLEQEKAQTAKRHRFSRWEVCYRLTAFVLILISFSFCLVSLLPGVVWITPARATKVLVVAFVLWVPIVWRKLLAFATFGPLWWLSCIAVGPMLLVLSIFALFFGPSLAFLHLFWEVSAEPTPPGAWLSVQLDPAGMPSESRGLMHGSLYDDSRAHAMIADWITRRATE
jgi:hypothetical protein